MQPIIIHGILHEEGQEKDKVAAIEKKLAEAMKLMEEKKQSLVYLEQSTCADNGKVHVVYTIY